MSASGAATPMTGVSTPMLVDEEAEEEDEDGQAAATAAAEANGEPSAPKKEIITCESVQTGKGVQKLKSADHTPTAPPSLLPAKKYCDITGLHAAYTDPRTKLRYKGLEVWNVVRNLVSRLRRPDEGLSLTNAQGPGGDQAYLALRGAQTALK